MHKTTSNIRFVRFISHSFPRITPEWCLVSRGRFIRRISGESIYDFFSFNTLMFFKRRMSGMSWNVFTNASDRWIPSVHGNLSQNSVLPKKKQTRKRDRSVVHSKCTYCFLLEMCLYLWTDSPIIDMSFCPRSEPCCFHMDSRKYLPLDFLKSRQKPNFNSEGV